MATLAHGAAATSRTDATDRPLRVYVGTYAGPTNPGVHAFEFNPVTGALDQGRVVAETPNPSFLVLHPNGRFVFAVNETARTGVDPGGSVSSFEIQPDTGTLRFLGSRGTRGDHPCHLAFDPTGRFLAVANYSGGSIALFACLPDGNLGGLVDFVQHEGSGPNPSRQQKPHAHGAYFDPAGRLLLVPDLGIDRVVVYALNAASNRLERPAAAALALPPGSGPRHLAFAPNGRIVYVVNELRSTVTTCAWDATTGAASVLQEISTLPPGFAGTSTTAEIAVHPSGRWVYASNRGHDSIAIFSVNPSSNHLTAAGHQPAGGRTPRHFAVAPSGRWLLAAHQDSNSIQVFRLDPATGALTTQGTPVRVPKPVCILFSETAGKP
jgi:6-phosphogluconolactonase